MHLDLAPGALCDPLGGRRWSPGEVAEQVARRAQAYAARGLGAGDRAFLHLGNSPEFFADLLAVWRLGASAVPVDARLTDFEVATLAEAARPRLALFAEPAPDELARLLAGIGTAVARSGEDAADAAGAPRGAGPRLDGEALVLFTSGTTGAPKGVVHTHRSLRARWLSLHTHLGLDRFERTLCLLPTHFGHGLICNALFPWLAGCELFVVPPFQTDLVMRLGQLVDEHRISFFSSVPSVWRLALKLAKPPGATHLRRVHCGSAPLSAHLWREIQGWCGTEDVANAYGITETGSWVAGSARPVPRPEDGFIGEPWGALVRVLPGREPEALLEPAPCAPGEAGHVWLQTPALMRGYLDRDDLTAEVVSGGWFATGDIGFVDEAGALTLRGREREEINKGGTKVYPGDVDGVAERFPAVRDVCSFACDDPLYGQNVALALVLDAPGDGPLRELHAWLRRHLAEYQMPVRWFRLDEIPRTSRGKVNRQNVAEQCRELEPVDLRRVLGGGP